jgi:S-(hydroxymethyl)glutathione dehydrogenase/alcohol dehydrogenase
VFGLGGIGLNVVQGAKLVGANRIIGVDLNPRRRALAEKFGMTDFVNPKEVGGDLVAAPDRDDRRRRRLQLRVRRQRRSHAPGARVLSPRLGRLGDHRRRRRGPGDQDAAVPVGHGRVWKGTAFGGARGRTDVPKIVDWYMDGKINIDDLITHTMPLADINKAFDLMHSGESIRSVVVY